MRLTSKRLSIGKMTCVNCQNKIEQKLLSTPGITEAAVSYRKGTAQITYDTDFISLNTIISIIENLDYEVLPEGKADRNDISRTVSLLVIIVSLYVLLQHFGILNLLVPSQLADTKMGYGMLFLIGLITSVHCIAMCGGINLSQCTPQSSHEIHGKDGLATFLPALFYNLGRVISYTVIGFLFGFIGMLIGGDSEIGLPVLFQGILKLIAGIFMVIMGINMLGIFPWLRKYNPHIPKSIAVKINRQKLKSRQPLFVGLLNGFMPCGPLQSMQIVALASGNPFSGAFSMFLFSIGTVPLMLGLGSIVSALGKKFSQKVMNIGAVLVVVLGLAMLSQGGSLSGFLLPSHLLVLVIALSILGVTASIPFRKTIYKTVSLGTVVILMTAGGAVWNHITETSHLKTAEEAALTDGIQVVNSTLSSGRYPNITVQAGTPVKWVIDAPAGSINGCNYKMLLNAFGIEHSFQEGENVIEFTPTTAGTYTYTCWMGMIRGNIFVTDGNDISSSADREVSDVPVPSGYKIPSEKLAIAELTTDEYGNIVQEVTIELTEKGFSPAVVVLQSYIQTIWHINVSLPDTQNETAILAPIYSTILNLSQGDNELFLYPSESFEIYTGDNAFFAYVKAVDNINQIDTAAIQKEADTFETLIYPASVFESAGTGASCCQ